MQLLEVKPEGWLKMLIDRGELELIYDNLADIDCSIVPGRRHGPGRFEQFCALQKGDQHHHSVFPKS